MSDKKKVDPVALVAKLAQEERQLLQSSFLAPVVQHGSVRIRVQGIVYEMTVDQAFEGWAILRMTSPGVASIIEQPSPALVARYLRLFPRVRIVLLQQFSGQWWGIAASTSDTRLQLTGPVAIHLVQTATASFQTVYARFDGTSFWFDGVDRRRDPTVARSLQRALDSSVAPQDLHCVGAVPQERLAYRMLFINKNRDTESNSNAPATQIARAVDHAGAVLQSYWSDQDNQITVRLGLNGRTHTVVVRSDDLTVLSAGICLSGEDSEFDLASLVSVFREYEGEM